MDLVTKEVAENDVFAWLDHKKMSTKRREEKKEAIESLVSYVQDGILSIDTESSFNIHQKLNFEIGNEIKIKELIWKPFGNVGRVQLQMKNVDSSDFTGNAVAHCCAQTGQSKGIINAMDSEDAAIMKIISVFFM